VKISGPQRRPARPPQGGKQGGREHPRQMFPATNCCSLKLRKQQPTAGGSSFCSSPQAAAPLCNNHCHSNMSQQTATSEEVARAEASPNEVGYSRSTQASARKTHKQRAFAAAGLPRKMNFSRINLAVINLSPIFVVPIGSVEISCVGANRDRRRSLEEGAFEAYLSMRI